MLWSRIIIIIIIDRKGNFIRREENDSKVYWLILRHRALQNVLKMCEYMPNLLN